MIKLKALTKRQQNKADKVAKLLKQLHDEGVVIMCNDGGGGRGLSYIRMIPYEAFWTDEIFYSSDEHHYERLSEFNEKTYENYDCPCIDCGAI